MRKLFIFFLFILGENAISQAQDSIKTVNSNQGSVNRVLIINSFDTESIHYRKNKKELFKELTDSLQSLLADQINGVGYGVPVIINQLISLISDSNRTIDSLLNTYNAKCAIVIEQLNASFEQTGVNRNRNDDGSKSREASYDICSEVNYAFYKTSDKPYHSKTRVCSPFTSRNVISGLFAGGPDIVGKSKHAFKIIAKNADFYILEIGDRLK